MTPHWSGAPLASKGVHQFQVAWQARIAIHHLNGVCACPLGGRLMDSRSRSALQRGWLCCHCLLLETDRGLVLVDTGYGLRDVRDPRSRLSGFFPRLMDPDFREEMSAVRQVDRRGCSANDVRHIVLTHLDFDHAGGLDDFPEARVHMMRTERNEAQRQRTWLDRQRLRPQQWNRRERWQVCAGRRGEPRYGFNCVRQLQGLRGDILLVPLTGDPAPQSLLGRAARSAASHRPSRRPGGVPP